jgi:hypothetical protein
LRKLKPLTHKAEGSTRLTYTGFNDNTFVTRGLDVVYYEMINRELNKRLLYECRCDERRKDKVERSTRLSYTMFRGGLEHLKIKTRFEL